MADPFEAFGNSFSQSFAQGQNRRFLNKQAEQEHLRRQQLAELQAQLQNQAMTPEEKLARAFADPGFRQSYQQIQQFNADPAGLNARRLDQAQQGLEQAQQGLGIQQFNAMTNRMNAGSTPQTRNFQFLQGMGALPPQNINIPLPGGGQLTAPNKDFGQAAQNFFAPSTQEDARIQQYNYFMGQNLGAFQRQHGRDPTPKEFADINAQVQGMIFKNPFF